MAANGAPAPRAPGVGPDAHALALLRAGDGRGAVAEVLRIHGPRVRDYLRVLLRDRDAADDAFSTFEEWTLASIATYQGTSSLRAWCLGIAHHAARRVQEDAWRRRRVRMRTDSMAAILAEAPSSSTARRERQAARLEALRRHLSPDEQSLLTLRLDQRLEWIEIAAVLARSGETVTPAALRKRFERLKERIGRLASAGE